MVPVKPSHADTQNNVGAGQDNTQTQDELATMSPPGPAAWMGDVIIKDWEWLVMVLSSLWMYDNPTIQSIVHNYINECDAATAAGVVQCLIPACKKEL